MIEENPNEQRDDWLRCPKCESERVSLKNISAWTDERPTVHCNSCGYGRYFD